MTDHSQRVATGIALLVCHQRKLLIGRRNKPPMPDSWQLPGGWLRRGEAVEDCVARLLSPLPTFGYSGLRFESFTNNRFPDGEHSISLYFSLQGVELGESDRFAERLGSDWRWSDWYHLPQPLFLPLAELWKSGYQPFTGE